MRRTFVEHPHNYKAIGIGRSELAVVLIPTDNHDTTIVPIKCLVHGQIVWGFAFIGTYKQSWWWVIATSTVQVMRRGRYQVSKL